MVGKGLGQWPWSKILGQDVGPRCFSRSWSMTLAKNADQWPWSKTPKTLIQGVGPKCCSTSWSVVSVKNANHCLGQRWPRSWSKRRCWSKVLVKDVDPGCWSKMVMKDLGLAKAGLVAWSCSRRLIKDTGERFLPEDGLGPRPQSKIWNQDFPQRCWGKTLANDLDQRSWGKMLVQGVVQGLGRWPWPKMLIIGQRHQRPWSKVLVQGVVQHLDQWPWSKMQIIDLDQRWPRSWSKRRCWSKILVKDVDPGCWSKMVMKDLGLAKAGLLHGLVPRGWSKVLVKDSCPKMILAQDPNQRSGAKIFLKDVGQRCRGKTLANDLDQRSWGKMLVQSVVQGLGQWPWPKMLISDLCHRHQRPWSKLLIQGVVQHLDQWPWSQMQAIDLGQRWPRPWSKRRCWSKILVKDVDPGCWSKMVMKDLGLAKAGLVAWSCSKRLVKDTGERFLPKDDLGPRPQSKIWN